MKILRAWPFALLIALAACSETTQDYDREEVAALHTKSLALLQQMAAAGAEHTGDCDAIATAWQQIYDDNKATFDKLVELSVAINTEQTKLAGEAKEAYKKDFEEPIEKAMESLAPVASECSDNEKLFALLKKIGSAGGGGGGGMSGH